MTLEKKVKKLKKTQKACQMALTEVEKQLKVYEGLQDEMSKMGDFLKEMDVKMGYA